MQGHDVRDPDLERGPYSMYLPDRGITFRTYENDLEQAAENWLINISRTGILFKCIFFLKTFFLYINLETGAARTFKSLKATTLSKYHV